MTVYATELDRANEDEIAALLGVAWGCDLRSFGAFAPLDWYAQRGGALVAVLELKCRTHPTDRYPTVYLAVRKWLALNLAAVGLDVPALFVVRFTDQVRYLRVGAEAMPARILGRRDRGAPLDIEPIIEVPVEAMHTVGAIR